MEKIEGSICLFTKGVQLNNIVMSSKGMIKRGFCVGEKAEEMLLNRKTSQG